MKPSFALNLSHDGLSLLHRAQEGWRLVGEVALDDPALADNLRYLRQTASDLAAGRLASKLVIPNSQVLYRTFELRARAGAARPRAIEKALDGLTPYEVDDLVFDWRDIGDGRVQVAAVARETLDEAEDFAVEHRFNPVSFVAVPAPGDFPAEPFFGQTLYAASLLASGDDV